MASRNLSDKFALPSKNVEYLEFDKSDGSPGLWPTATTRIVDREGQVNFMQLLDLDSPTAAKWRTQVGKAIALDLKLPGGKSYVMRDWPTGYRLYDHHKGPADAPRHDVYLYGSPRGRFRSINEFIPHAIWLMRDAKNQATCLCKYCSKKSQKEITASMGPLASTQLSAGGSGTRVMTARDKKPREPFIRHSRKGGEDQGIYAAVQKIPKPVEGLKPSSNITTQYAMLVERNADLRAMYTRSGIDDEDSAVGQTGIMRMRRWFREGELVWCALNPPIVDEKTGAAIKFWPGIVDEAKLHSEGVPKASTTANEKGKAPMSNGTLDNAHSVQNTQSNSSAKPNRIAGPSQEQVLLPEPPILPTPASVPWSIRQHLTYRIQLLAVAHWCDALDDQVLPYQAYVPPTDLIRAMQSFPASKLDFSKEVLEGFNPCPALGPGNTGPVTTGGLNLNAPPAAAAGGGEAGSVSKPIATTVRFEDAVAPFAMAVQIGSQTSEYWSLTDDWEFEFKVVTKTVSAGTGTGTGLRQGTGSGGSTQHSAPSASTAGANGGAGGPGASATSGASLSLQDALTAMAQHNASLGTGRGKSLASTPAALAPAPSTPAEASTTPSTSVAARLSRNQDATATAAANGSDKLTTEERTVVQTRFQGLWWGAERIWTDEVIRLKVPRRCLAPKGAENIYAPAGPGKRARENWEKMGRDPEELGAGTRGVFMRLDGLFLADVSKGSGEEGGGGGARKECRACGMLYELVDEDWEDEGGGAAVDGQQGEQQKAQENAQPAPSQQQMQLGTGEGPKTINEAVLPNTQISTPSISTEPLKNGASPAASKSKSPMIPSSPYPLPPAPSGYKFRPILPQGYEAVVSLSLISGRYYPRILSHPLMRETLEQALENSLENGGLMVYNNLWALEGLAAGLYNSVDPSIYKASRERMVEDGDREARELLERHRQERESEEQGGAEGVEVDGGVQMGQVGGSISAPVSVSASASVGAGRLWTNESVDELAAMEVDP
ncbi:hypothetical protein AX16_009278 [Volvariella volvacea WC 439]|nr:hypothetical protein AX16_009278 [Volvariella volvacea WC 439]